MAFHRSDMQLSMLVRPLDLNVDQSRSNLLLHVNNIKLAVQGIDLYNDQFKSTAINLK